MLPKRQWMEMTWTDLAESDTRRWIAVLPVAAVEQHGPHLPLGVDSYIAQAYLSRVHEILPDDLPVTFLPMQKLGQSDEHIAYPGTLSLSAQTVIRAYKVQFTAPADLQDVHVNVIDVDLRDHTANRSWQLPVPASFVIDRAGVVRAARVSADYRTRMEPADIIAALNEVS